MTHQSTSSVYDKTYEYYLEQLKSKPFEGRETILGIRLENDGVVVIPYFGELICLTREGLINGAGQRPDFSDCVVLCRYLLMAPEAEPSQADWVAFRDFPDAGPLTVFWAETVEGLLTKTFTRRVDALKKASDTLGGYASTSLINADLCRILTPLPKIPLLLVFNDADDEFPATASLLFEKRASYFLDAESQAILGHRLADRLSTAG